MYDATRSKTIANIVCTAFAIPSIWESFVSFIRLVSIISPEGFEEKRLTSVFIAILTTRNCRNYNKSRQFS